MAFRNIWIIPTWRLVLPKVLARFSSCHHRVSMMMSTFSMKLIEKERMTDPKRMIQQYGCIQREGWIDYEERVISENFDCLTEFQQLY